MPDTLTSDRVEQLARPPVLRLFRERAAVRWMAFGVLLPLALAAFVAAQNPAPYGRDGEFWRVWAMFSVIIGVPWAIAASVTALLDRWTPLGRGPLLVLLGVGALAGMLVTRAALSWVVPFAEPIIIGPLAAERPMAVVPPIPPDFRSLLDTFRVNFIWIVIWIGSIYLLDRSFHVKLFQRRRAVSSFSSDGHGPDEALVAPPRRAPFDASGTGDTGAGPSNVASKDAVGPESDGSASSPRKSEGGLLLERCKTVARRPDEILLLKAEDHYLRVFGAQANELVLFRMSDAMRELASAEGSQVHRSYWVARKAVRGFLLDDGQYELLLENGMRVPVSRTFVDRARAAGLLGNRLFR